MSVEYSQTERGDLIDQLPTDKLDPSPNEIQLANNLFKVQKNFVSKMAGELKGIVIMLVLFIVISLEHVDKLFYKFLPMTEKSPYILLLLKGLVFVIVYYFIRNMYLIRRSK